MSSPKLFMRIVLNRLLAVALFVYGTALLFLGMLAYSDSNENTGKFMSFFIPSVLMWIGAVLSWRTKPSSFPSQTQSIYILMLMLFPTFTFICNFDLLVTDDRSCEYPGILVSGAFAFVVTCFIYSLLNPTRNLLTYLWFLLTGGIISFAIILIMKYI